MSGLLGVSLSGLQVSQTALRVAGHNIANANTEGYSRQSTEITSAGGQLSGAGYVGNGAQTSSIERTINGFVTTQIRQDTSLSSGLQAYNDSITQLNDAISSDSPGLTMGLESFFSALQNATDDPTSTPARQLLISQAEGLQNRFNGLYERVETIKDSVDANVKTAVQQINMLASSIASLNVSISSAKGISADNTPNDLLDQRDEALRSLSELVSVQVLKQGDQVNVTVGNGVPVVVGTKSNALSAEQNEFNPNQFDIFAAGFTTPINDTLSGGQLGGLLDFEANVIDPTFNDLGRIALVLADQFNEIQAQGITLNNNFGQDIFADINGSDKTLARVLPSINNQTSDQVVGVSITDTAQLTTSDYRFSISGTNFNVVRLSDNREIANGALPAIPGTIEFDGLSIDLQSGTFSNNDEFLVQPTRSGAQNFAVNPIQVADIALGSPLLTDTNLGNLGTAKISSGQVLSVNDAAGTTLPLFAQAGEFSPPLLVKFTTPTSYDILDNSDLANPIQLDPPIRNQIYVQGIQNNLFPTDVGQTTVVSEGAVLGLPAGRTEVDAATGDNNDYPSEDFIFTRVDPVSGAISTRTITSIANASARATAGTLDNVDGISATAFNNVELRDLDGLGSLANPFQITLNGEDLVASTAGVFDPEVPNPALNSGEDFNDYIAAQINSNQNLTALGIVAVSAFEASTGEYFVQIDSTRGDDLTVQLEASSGSINVNDGTANPDVAITAAGPGNVNEVVVGGRIDVSLASDIILTTTPATSAIFGAITASSAFIGIQASISGGSQAGDQFSLDFNTDAAFDNRNGLALSNLQGANTIVSSTSRNSTGPDQSFGDSYSTLLETVGIKTNISNQDTDAANSVLTQTINLRNSISGVSLDEEAADLIQYQQLYSANAQVINVAREIFDQLLNSL
jgi:flagellar hook-associated protein 1 FlgK